MNKQITKPESKTKRHRKKKGFRSRPIHQCELIISCAQCRRQKSCDGKRFYDMVLRVQRAETGQVEPFKA